MRGGGPCNAAAAGKKVEAMAPLFPWWAADYLQQMRDAVERWELAEDFDDRGAIDMEREWIAERLRAWSSGALARLPAPIDRLPGESAHDYAGRLLDLHCYGPN